MKAVEALVDRYCSAWSSPDPNERERVLRTTLVPAATYCDPRSGLLHVDGLLDYIAQVQVTRPGSRVVRTTVIDLHHRVARFHWQVFLRNGDRLPEGLYVVDLSAGLESIERIVGFFGPLTGLRAAS